MIRGYRVHMGSSNWGCAGVSLSEKFSVVTE